MYTCVCVYLYVCMCVFVTPSLKTQYLKMAMMDTSPNWHVYLSYSEKGPYCFAGGQRYCKVTSGLEQKPDLSRLEA